MSLPRPYKECPKCLRTLDSSCFPRAQYNYLGLHGWCVTCIQEKVYQVREEQAATVPETIGPMFQEAPEGQGKHCRKCGRHLPFVAFRRDTRFYDGLLAICFPCESAGRRIRYKRKMGAELTPEEDAFMRRRDSLRGRRMRENREDWKADKLAFEKEKSTVTQEEKDRVREMLSRMGL